MDRPRASSGYRSRIAAGAPSDRRARRDREAGEEADVQLGAVGGRARAGHRTGGPAAPEASVRGADRHAVAGSRHPREIGTPSDPAGYLRLWSFNVDRANAYIVEMRRLLKLLPQSGLVVDVRGNPGGYIEACERLLQILAPHPIQPARFGIRATRLAAALATTNEPSLGPWASSLSEALNTGEPYSQHLPLSDLDADVGRARRAYPGPMGPAIVDSTTYSCGDLFAAGFVDNEIGPVLAVGTATGAGGQRRVGRPRPAARDRCHGTSGSPAATRCRTHVVAASDGPHQPGRRTRHRGCRSPRQHEMTLDDVLHSNCDLLAARGSCSLADLDHTSGSTDGAGPGARVHGSDGVACRRRTCDDRLGKRRRQAAAIDDDIGDELPPGSHAGQHSRRRPRRERDAVDEGHVVVHRDVQIGDAVLLEDRLRTRAVRWASGSSRVPGVAGARRAGACCFEHCGPHRVRAQPGRRRRRGGCPAMGRRRADLRTRPRSWRRRARQVRHRLRAQRRFDPHHDFRGGVI